MNPDKDFLYALGHMTKSQIRLIAALCNNREADMNAAFEEVLKAQAALFRASDKMGEGVFFRDFITPPKDGT